jgi:CopG family transcriptional regulator, nickel-responsive regulator
MVEAMQRVTITIDDDLVAEIDAFMAGRSYANRSEAIRDLARSGLSQSSLEVAHDHNCVATLSYVYDHAARELPKRLTQDFHAHHGLAQATLHVHLDHDSCLEVTVLKGRSAEVKAFADHVIAERGVRHGHIAYMPADAAAHPRDRHPLPSLPPPPPEPSPQEGEGRVGRGKERGIVMSHLPLIASGAKSPPDLPASRAGREGGDDRGGYANRDPGPRTRGIRPPGAADAMTHPS